VILLDTNLLTRMTDSANPQCAVARRAVHTLLGDQERLAATMESYGITRLLTFNTDNFKGFVIMLLDPASF